MQRAKSRLEKSLEKPVTTTKKRKRLSQNNSPHPLLLSYLKRAPLLLIAVLWYCLLGYLLTTRYPSESLFQFGPIPYLLPVLIFFFGTFFAATFLSLNTRRGLLIASALSWLAFLRVQQVSVGLGELGVMITVLLVTEFCLIGLKRLSA